LTDTVAAEVNDLETAEQDRTETPLESLASICTVLAIGLFVMTFIFQNFEIPSASMVKTLLIGDHVLVDRIALAPPAKWAPFVFYRDIHRGDIIVFFKPGEPDLFLVKRTIGVPGDRIHLRNGVVYLNGVAQNEPKAVQITSANYDPYRDDFPSIPSANVPGVTAEWSLDLPTHIQGEDLVVPPDSSLVMGDNRTNSLDGRLVPRANLIGRPLFVYWSFKTPDDQVDKNSLADRASFTSINSATSSPTPAGTEPYRPSTRDQLPPSR
jgi:signal peptidase I